MDILGEKSRVAVVVPVYNAEKTLRACIHSILKQTFSDLTLVLVDDGSTDKSGKICDEFALADPRVTVIHQENRGSVEARKRGVLSANVQSARYLFLSDADDTLEKDAIKVLYETAEQFNADLVCGQARRLWKGLRISAGFCPPCFQISQPTVYNNKEIIEQLYISCFGISNFPVSLYAKLYRTDLVTRVIDYPPVVRFMGEDLSVTLRIMPETEKLVIIPNVVYNYRVGGGTSKFMPYMLDDFLSLYRYKLEFAKRNPMPQNAFRLMDIELMNVVRSYLLMCADTGRFTIAQLRSEAEKICAYDIIQKAATGLMHEKNPHQMAQWISKDAFDEITQSVIEQNRKERKKRVIKRMLMSL